MKLRLDKDLFQHQLSFAWEHFKFHAEQRTRMFRFFLIVASLLLGVFSFADNKSNYQEYAYFILCIGGFLSAIFLSLDVRNTQLLEQSEDILCKIEEDLLYSDLQMWTTSHSGCIFRLGIFSREALLKRYYASKGWTAFCALR